MTRAAAGFATLAVVATLTAAPAANAGNPERGRKIAEEQCARCHVVGAHNRMGGIGSTASFQMIAKMEDGMERFQTFYIRRPHPAFLTVPGIAPWSTQPGARYAKQFTLTLGQIQDIVAFAETLKSMPIQRKKRN